MEDPSLEPLISSVGVLSCYGTLGTTQARGKQTGSDMEHRLASPFTFASPSLTVPARTFRHTQQMQPANVIVVCISLLPLYFCFLLLLFLKLNVFLFNVGVWRLPSPPPIYETCGLNCFATNYTYFTSA